MTLMIGAISSRSSLSKRGLSLSGPAALPGLRLSSNFNRPFRDTQQEDVTDINVYQNLVNIVLLFSCHRNEKLCLLR